MEEFFKSNYGALTSAVELLAVLVGVFTFNKFKNTHVKYFIYYLFAVAILEIVAIYPDFIKNDWIDTYRGSIFGLVLQNNMWLYTVFWTFGGSLFFSFYFRQILVKPLHKSIIRFLTVVLVLAFVVYYGIYFEKLFSDFTFLGGELLSFVLLITCSILYFVEILQSERILYFYHSVNFYISLVILFWWLIITPITFYDDYFNTNDWNFIILKWQIYLAANIFMYLTYCFALIFCKPNNHMSLPLPKDS